MVGDLMSGQIDLILASLTYTLERSQGIKYLHPLAQEKRSLFISAADSDATLSWMMYFEPFTMSLWIMILITALLNAIFFNFFNYIYGKIEQVSIVVSPECVIVQ